MPITCSYTYTEANGVPEIQSTLSRTSFISSVNNEWGGIALFDWNKPSQHQEIWQA